MWRPAIGEDEFEDIVYSRLAAIAATHTTKKKTYNNVVSALRCAFDFAYKDHPEKHNPASGLTTFRIQKKDRPPVVYRRHKDRTETGVDREITLCGRALDVLKRQLLLREELRRAGKIDHDLVFFDEDGAPIINLSYPYRRWGYVLESRKVRYREPYNARHSCVSWRLMAGHNVMLVAEEDGHSVATMLKTYAAWTRGATAADTEVIKRAMECSPLPPSLVPSPKHSSLQRTRWNPSPSVPGICHQTATTEE